jgi:hypothetical protein
MGLEVGQYVYYPKGLNIEIKQNENGFEVDYDIVSIYDLLAIGVEE